MAPSNAKPMRQAIITLTAIAAVSCAGDPRPRQEDVSSPAAGFDLLADNQLAGWSRVTEPQHYGVDNLWEYINGQADFFLDYGFERVDTAEYRNEGDAASVVLEVYRMSRPEEAFGIFAAERTPDDRPLGVGAQAYLGTNILGFWQAEFYVKLTSFDESPAVAQLMIGLAEGVSSRLPRPGGELETLLLFPEEGRIEASERFIPHNFLGQPYLIDAYRVDYSRDGEDVRLFLVDCASPGEAQAKFERLEDFYRGRDATEVTLETTEDSPTLIVDGPSKAVIFQLDHRLGGAFGFQGLDTGREAAAALVEQITR